MKKTSSPKKKKENKLIIEIKYNDTIKKYINTIKKVYDICEDVGNYINDDLRDSILDDFIRNLITEDKCDSLLDNLSEYISIEIK